jgi:hypothetical protein
MRLLLLVGSVLIFLSTLASADIPFRREAFHDDGLENQTSGWTSGTCTIVYYNYCSGWLWTYAPFAPARDRYYYQIGVVFNLPADCGKMPGEVCTNTGFWWYWRYTLPGYIDRVSYDLWVVDEDACKVGPSLGTLPDRDPIERWNYYSGLGSTTADHVAIMASPVSGSPRIATDNNARNSQAPIACADWPGPIEPHSFWFGTPGTQYCPPDAFRDGFGPVQILMRASFSCEATAVEPSSWGAIKTLFR